MITFINNLIIVRWNSEESSLKEGTFVGQCAFLNSYYHYLQILVHRPHISDPLKQGLGFRSQSAIPSMTICTNAARRTQRILNAFCDRKGSEVGWLPPHTEVWSLLCISHIINSLRLHSILYLYRALFCYSVYGQKEISGILKT